MPSRRYGYIYVHLTTLEGNLKPDIGFQNWKIGICISVGEKVNEIKMLWQENGIIFNLSKCDKGRVDN